MSKMWYLYAMKYHPATAKKKTLTFVTEWMDLESIMLSEIRQTEKHRCHKILLICGTHRSRTHRCREQLGFARDGGWEVGAVGEVGTRNTLPVTR